ncbi:NYN domain-containing protein [Staphylospora marina]|uniref:NYN domain-containing protein n=1 Tax=Staphylospora marina TaxID=2490858 RepID=UPI000F5BBA6E|nr:NYN domain-containing protein [Staphylospora marina]
MAKREEWLVVDGYNVIGADPRVRWQPRNLEEQRSRLITALSEYQAMSGQKVFIVFDAHHAAGAGSEQVLEQVTVFFTRRDETADEFIERFVKQFKSPHRVIYVATSDYLEQRMVFGQGAYRLSSRELLQKIGLAKKELGERLRREEREKARNPLEERLDAEAFKKLEKWRRKK